MKFTMHPGPWPSVIREIEAAGHRYVTDVAEAEFLIYNGGRAEGGAAGLPSPLPESIGFIQYPFAGVEHLIDAGLIRPDVRWANAGGVYGRPVAEIALSLLLAQMHQIKASAMIGSFRGRNELDARQGWLFDGAKVALIGAGGIGSAMIDLLAPFGVYTIAVNRSGRPVAGATETFAMAAAEHVWSEADYFVLTAPLTEETRGIVDAGVFARMKTHAVVVNVGRGELIVTDDLVAALRGGQIAGAALDVTDPEPLPENHPLWSMPNCTILPHIAATGRIAQKLIAPQIIANAAAFEAGEKMPTEVDVEAGY
ncbi:D-isomer specific 2-hydroxyacid dehydrogenase family protein [Corynebacterium sp. A21]|uniref:D-isomer specific 2-hydroxyacid dehydrogenase family protein n=1 Tax=Corynebacterium sp. A21 TaxID=3457318 RepID=UPI003FD1CCC7